MKIVHFLGTARLPLLPDEEGTGGLTRVALEIARAQQASGHDVWVATTARRRGQGQWHGVRLISLPLARYAPVRLRGFSVVPRVHIPFVVFAQQHQFDVIHGHEYAYLRGARSRVRVVHVHNDPSWRAPRQFRALDRHTHAQIAVSEFVAGQLRDGFRRATNAGRPAGNVHLVYSGVDHQRFAGERWKSERTQLRSAWGVGDDDVVFLFAGSVTREKGVFHLAHAFRHLREHTTGVHLVIAGDSSLWHGSLSVLSAERKDYEDSVRAILRPASERGEARFLGVVAAAGMPAIYAASDVVVTPSVSPEAYCLTAVEALAASRPVIASAVGGLPEVVGPEAGVFVAPGDEQGLCSAMAMLARDSGLRAQLKRNAGQSVQRFNWTRAARELDEIYATILDRPTARPPIREVGP